jgi:SAM-dependent methyltransferase
MYDDFSADYDRFVDWPARLAVELPFIVGRVGNPSYVLDAACGTGMHAIALAQRGYRVVGADASAGMIERAQVNAAAAGVDVRFEVAGFGELARVFVSPNPSPPLPPARGGEGEEWLPQAAGVGIGGFDALLCLGNSLPHLLTLQALHAALADFAACLRPGGLVIIQNRNFDRVVARRERWMEPQARREEDAEWLFLRFYDFDPDGLLTFNVVTLKREGMGTWDQRTATSRLRPLRKDELTAALSRVDFEQIICYGDMHSAPFDADESPNLVVTARKHTEHAIRNSEITFYGETR